MPTNNPRRLTELGNLIAHHWVDLSQHTDNCQQLLSYFNQTRVCQRFAIVARPLAPCSSPSAVITAEHADFHSAVQTATKSIEAAASFVPLEIVNLDTGDRWLPVFTQIPWQSEEPRPPLAIAPAPHVRATLELEGTS